MKDIVVIDGARYTTPQLREIVARAAATLKAVGAEDVLEDLVRRDRMRNEIDGWPGGGTVARRSTDVARPTEDTGLRLAEGLPLRDDVHMHVEQIIRSTLALAGHVGIIELRMKALASRHGKLGRVNSTGTCQACERTVAGTEADRLRSGYCPACFQAWGREGRPDRVAFERSRRERKAS